MVHQIAGFSALAAALVVGRRNDFSKADTSPHNVPFIALGTGLLWFGWFGFNAGSSLNSSILSVSAFNATHMATAGAGLVIGIVGAAAANFVAYLRGKSQLDDSLDVFACHGVGGLVGTLLTGVFASKAINSAGADGSAAQIFTQLKSSLFAGVYAFVVSFIVLKVIDMVVGLRPTTENETKGLDHSEHGEKAYLN